MDGMRRRKHKTIPTELFVVVAVLASVAPLLATLIATKSLLFLSSPLWVPIPFLVYPMVRKRFSWWVAVALISAEVMAVRLSFVVVSEWLDAIISV
jgi:hypothetical protein